MYDKQYMKKQNFEETVDLWRYAKALYKRIWVIILATVMVATGTFAFSATMITPTYRSGFITYVNNKLELSTGGNTTVSDLNASYALAYVYESVITSRSVVTDAVDLCKRNGRLFGKPLRNDYFENFDAGGNAYPQLWLLRASARTRIFARSVCRLL